MTIECPHCHQPMLTRFGVTMTRTKADIIDMIEDVTNGRGGVDSETLGWVFYPGVSKSIARQRIKVHICQINDLLCSTDWQIVNEGGLYKLKEMAVAK